MWGMNSPGTENSMSKGPEVECPRSSEGQAGLCWNEWGRVAGSHAGSSGARSCGSLQATEKISTFVPLPSLQRKGVEP